MAKVLSLSEVDALLNAVNGYSPEEKALIVVKKIQSLPIEIKKKVDKMKSEYPTECEALVKRYSGCIGKDIEEELILRSVLNPEIFPLSSLDPEDYLSFPVVNDEDDLSGLRDFF